ncbi:TolC family protein [Duganella sp. BJB1802]|uniref:TolC family protein n=1 Tax=Duganella sp. BJB1802 TaxID=2744575 RepID=UPI001592D0B8|nr:TolC family protein [Duganella sp. BJB1802]NVD73402.1 TolC family protein [Duganella sp. BJB1802]
MFLALKTPLLRHGLLLACACASACSSYQPLPLQEGQPARLVVDTRSLPFPAMAAHRFDPDDGLDIVEVAMLAVVNNPELRLVRDDAAIAHAQSFSAGLLPDPQLSFSRDLSNSGGAGATTAFGAGLSYDVASLLTHGAQHRATENDAAKTDLTLLWQEWQVAAQAQLLFVKVVQGRKQMAVLNDTRQVFADRYARTRRALDGGLLNSDAVAPNLAALQDVDRQLFDLRKLQNQSAHELNALLGLAPGTVLALRTDSDAGAVDAALARSALDDLAQRRPDLRALQAAYQAEDQRYRGALLAQFPALTLGFTRARDSSNVYSSGIGVTMSLPFLNRNRGNIAISQASRQKAYDEYQVRVQAARNDVRRILDEQALNLAQAARLDADLRDQAGVLARSDRALRAGDADVLAYTLARSALLARQLERLALEQAMLEQRVGLRTVLGIDMTNLESVKP